MANKIKVHKTLEFKSFIFHYMVLNWIISVIFGAKFTKFGTCVGEDHSERTGSQNFDLHPSFYLMKS